MSIEKTVRRSNSSTLNNFDNSRRRFIKTLSCAPLIAVGMPGIAESAALRPKSLSFFNLHTGEKLALTYFESGQYITEALVEVNQVLRDHRTGDVYDIDTALLD